MSRLRYYIIMNPYSKGGRSRAFFDQIREAFEVADVDYEFKIIADMAQAVELSVYANENGWNRIIAVGGDGTINAVINGFFDAKGKRISNAAFGVIYTGTSPDFCKSYSIPTQVEKAIDVILQGEIKQIPIGKMICMASNTVVEKGVPVSTEISPVVKFFSCCANIGLGAELARRANGGIRQYLGDLPGTFISLIFTLISFKSSTFSIVKDGTLVTHKKMLNCSVGLTKYIASGIQAPVNNCGLYGQFYVMILNAFSISKFPSVVKRVYSGIPFINDKTLSIDRASSLEFYSNPSAPEIEMDGDPAGYLPCKIEMAKESLDLLC